ncbi:MAG: hypothetical protein ACQKBW_09230 [Puniceicoccales bacterium]
MLISLFVLTSCLAIVITVVLQGVRNAHLARETAIVTSVLQNEIESLRLENWSSLSSYPEDEEVEVDEDFLELSKLTSLTVTRTLTTDEDNADIMIIRLKGEWLSNSNIPQSKTLLTKYTKGGMYDYYYSD